MYLGEVPGRTLVEVVLLLWLSASWLAVEQTIPVVVGVFDDDDDDDARRRKRSWI